MTDEAVRAMADRIEELDRACSEWADASQANYQRAKTAEAKLAKAQDQIKAQAAEIERLRAKLAKAVDALHEAWFMLTVPMLNYQPEPEEPGLRRIKDALDALTGDQP